MTDTSAPLAPTLWVPPPAVHTRGTLAVIAGTDESARVYERFGRRIAIDGYAVGIFEAADAGQARGWLAGQEASPRVLVGSDIGAAAVLTALAERDEVDGAIVAATPVGATGPVDVAARTACPVHLGVLAGEAARTHRGIEITLPERDFLTGVIVPVLAVHGGSDAVAPFGDAEAYLEAIPSLDLVETIGGLHDSLNDVSHRSVAAKVVLWLEALRSGTPVVRVVAS
jgi:alpha-beta hydrolase superfamily lysophospholipase